MLGPLRTVYDAVTPRELTLSFDEGELNVNT